MVTCFWQGETQVCVCVWVCVLVCNLSSDILSRVIGSSPNKICQDCHVPTTVQESWHTHAGTEENNALCILQVILKRDSFCSHCQWEQKKHFICTFNYWGTKKKKHLWMSVNESRNCIFPSLFYSHPIFPTFPWSVRNVYKLGQVLIEREREQGHIFWQNMNLFSESSLGPSSFLEVPLWKLRGAGSLTLVRTSFARTIPIKDFLFGGKKSPVSGPPTTSLHGGMERRAWSGEVLSKRGPSESLES